MEVRFSTDRETDLPHIYDHGVAEEEAEEILGRPGEIRRERRGTYSKLGQTATGRFLRVIYTMDREAGIIYVITAYQPTARMVKGYRRRRKR